jgi:hypothetical protein
MEQDQTPNALPQPDRAQFERVWRRVMPEERADCPFTLLPQKTAAPLTQNRLMPNASDPSPPDFMPGPALELGLAPMTPMEKRPPSVNPAPGLMAAAPAGGQLMQNMISAELSSAHTYRKLARLTCGQSARMFSSLASDEGRHAKRISAAYFLIAGVRFWPENLPGEPVDTLWGGIRRQFISAQKAEASYSKLAEGAEDYLKDLFSELALDEAGHAARLRKLLEEL